MHVLSYLILGTILIVPAVGLWALWWAGGNGEFARLDRAALLPFDDEEPAGTPTDQILNTRRPS